MDIETIQARTAYIPSIDSMVRLVTLEPPNNFADVKRDDTPEVENALRDLAQTIFGVPSQHVVTYSNWRSTSETLRTKINGEVFKTQMRQAYAGNDEKLGKSAETHAPRSGSVITR
jgi:hypothetical protein